MEVVADRKTQRKGCLSVVKGDYLKLIKENVRNNLMMNAKRKKGKVPKMFLKNTNFKNFSGIPPNDLD